MVNITGSGLAGLSAAITLARKGIHSNIISMQEAQRAQSVMAEGGINAALNTMNENDDVFKHYEDTLKGGAYLADPNAVEGLVKQAPQIVNELLKLGVPFEMEGKKIIQRNFGGQKNKRTAYVKSSTGKMLMSALIDEARKYEARGLIRVYDHHKAAEVVIEDGVCKGLIMKDQYTNQFYKLEGPVILASGGLGGFFQGYTTGSSDNTGELSADCFMKGVKMANLEMIQYHPTTIDIIGKRMLVSEAARGEGGRFMTYKDGKEYYFMEEMYPKEKNLVTRDVASHAVTKILNDKDCDGNVYLDMRHLDKKVFERKLSDMREEVKDYQGIDIARQPFRISPGIHYFMGGFYVNEKHETNITNLYAAGECACQYHGANRLGGNSLLGAIYGGKKAAENFTEDLPGECIQLTDQEDADVSPLFSKKLTQILLGGLGIIRNEETIKEAIVKLDELDHDLNSKEHTKLILGKAMLRSALERKESRGAHYREDYPKTLEEFHKTSVASYDKDIDIRFEDIPERRSA